MGGVLIFITRHPTNFVIGRKKKNIRRIRFNGYVSEFLAKFVNVDLEAF
jgi:hypothetical protein